MGSFYAINRGPEHREATYGKLVPVLKRKICIGAVAGVNSNRTEIRLK
jgi:hypothetical protein